MASQTKIDREHLAFLVSSGEPIVILDDRKELEGDLFCAAEVVVPEVLQFMIRKCSGFLCLAMPRDRLEEIGIPRISETFSALYQFYNLKVPGWEKFQDSLERLGNPDTPFHFPVDLRGTHSGISVEERFATIQALLLPEATIDQFECPGHLPLLGAHSEGFKGRIGHTETAIELCNLAGVKSAGLLCEIVDDDGTMCRGDQLTQFALDYSLETITITEIIQLVEESHGN